jgi:hypothetical protein
VSIAPGAASHAHRLFKSSEYFRRHAISGSISPIVLLFGKMTLKSARSFEYKHKGRGVR